MADDSLMDEDRYELDRATVQAVQVAAETGEAERLADSLEPMHPADIADLLEQVGPEPRQMILKVLGSGFDGEILSEIDNPFRAEVIGALDLPVLVEAVRDLESDDIVDIIQHLDPPLRSTLLNALQGVRRVAVEQALGYPEFSAGRLMQREMVAGPEHWTVGDAIDHLRARQDLPEDFYHMILVDPKHRPTGYVALGKILGHPREERLQAIAADSFHIIEAKQEEGEVAYAFNQYHLISAPVVDGDGRLVGVITIDDAMGVLAEEAEEDLLRLAGVSDGSSLAGSAFDHDTPPISVACRELGHGGTRLGGDRGLRGFDRQDHCAGDTYADHRLDGWKRRNPVPHCGGARDRDQGSDRFERMAGDPA